MSKAEEKSQNRYPTLAEKYAFIDGYEQAEKDVAESFARIIRSNLSGIGNGIQNMFEQLYTEITGEKMYKGFKD